MSYTLKRHISRPIPGAPTWRISGRYGNYFIYIDIERYASVATAYDAMKKVGLWLNRRHPYLMEAGGWLEGPFIQEVEPDWLETVTGQAPAPAPASGTTSSLPDPLV